MHTTVMTDQTTRRDETACRFEAGSSISRSCVGSRVSA
jgi:hypothetical protein